MERLLTRSGCMARQRRLHDAMVMQDWSGFLTGHARTIYYLTGALLEAEAPAALMMRRNGRTILISPRTDALAADECIPVDNYSVDRIIADPHADVAALLAKQSVQGTWAVEMSYTPWQLTRSLPFGTVHDAGGLIRLLRKRKEEDEIAEIQRSLDFSRVAYRAARDAIRPGLTEIDVYNTMAVAATAHAGHTLRLSGDFACGNRCIRGGGPPTTNILREGDLYILDLFPACAFYYGDTCRTFCVGKPSNAQQDAWQVVAGTLGVAAQLIRPGLPARELYKAVRTQLEKHSLSGSFWHHAGHGVGLLGHDSPRLIPGSDEVIEAGDVIAVEPALYSESLRGGIRLENTYLVRESGAEPMFAFPLEL